MNVVDNNYFEELERDENARILESAARLKKGIFLRNVYEIVSLEDDYATLGTIDFCYKHDVTEGKRMFYKSSLCQAWLMEHYDEYKNKLCLENVTTYSYPTLYYGILSGNKNHMFKRAELFGKYVHMEQDEFLANKLLGYSLKYVMLNDVENANRWIEELQKVRNKRGMKQLATGQGIAMRGIINNNEEEFNEGLLKMLKNHVGRMKREGDCLLQFFAYDSVALAMLAKERGINVTVKHDLLPDEYFVETDIDYDEITLF